jgi:PKD repeat protein
LSIPPNKTSRIVAVRDDGTERHLGQVTNPIAATSDPVVFVIDDPWEDDDNPQNDSSYDNTVALIDASPSGPTVGETVTLSASGSTAAGANNEIDTVEWSLPDGTTPTGIEATWTPQSGDGDATHPISVTVTDTSGNSDTTQVQLYVASEGAPGSGQPTAYAEVVTAEPKAGDPVRIEDRSEPPANGEIDRVEWDTTGDGTYDDGQGPFVESTYDEPGVQQVSVRTVAQSGATDVYTSTIYVAAGNESQLNQPPVAEVVVDPRDPVVGETVSVDASNSVGIGSATISSYEWELPDGTTATGQTASYSPSEAGAGVVTLTVTDSNGREASTQGSLYVAQNASARALPPQADFAIKTETPKVGEPVALEATPELDDTASLESVKWDFDGDGDFSDADGESVEFTPEQAGITEVGVEVTDSNGAKSQFYEYFFVTGSASQLSIGGGGGGGGTFGAGGGLGGDGPGGLPGGAPAVLGGTATAALFIARRAGAPVPMTAVGAAGAATTAALVAPDATAAAVESVPTVGWVAGGIGAVGVALQRAGVDVRGALSNLPVIGDRL